MNKDESAARRKKVITLNVKLNVIRTLRSGDSEVKIDRDVNLHEVTI